MRVIGESMGDTVRAIRPGSGTTHNIVNVANVTNKL
jgi:hypothetical protein